MNLGCWGWLPLYSINFIKSSRLRFKYHSINHDCQYKLVVILDNYRSGTTQPQNASVGEMNPKTKQEERGRKGEGERDRVPLPCKKEVKDLRGVGLPECPHEFFSVYHSGE